VTGKDTVAPPEHIPAAVEPTIAETFTDQGILLVSDFETSIYVWLTQVYGISLNLPAMSLHRSLKFSQWPRKHRRTTKRRT
jgi:hypothetical protein